MQVYRRVPRATVKCGRKHRPAAAAVAVTRLPIIRTMLVAISMRQAEAHLIVVGAQSVTVTLYKAISILAHRHVLRATVNCGRRQLHPVVVEVVAIRPPITLSM